MYRCPYRKRCQVLGEQSRDTAVTIFVAQNQSLKIQNFNQRAWAFPACATALLPSYNCRTREHPLINLEAISIISHVHRSKHSS